MSKSPPHLLTLIFLTGLSVLSLNMFLPSLLGIADEFKADYSQVSLSVSGYLGITAVVQLTVGPLSDRFGRRPVLLLALVIFIIGSVGCLFANSIWVFLGFRVLQAAIISGWVLCLAIVRDSTAEREAASRIGYISMAMAVAPMLGPMLGGILDELYGWRSSFVFFTLFGSMVLGICWLDLGETNKNPSATFARQFSSYAELFASPRYWGYSFCIMFSTGAFYIFLTGVPLVAEAILHLSPAELGFYMGTITAGFAFGSFLSGRYSTIFGLTVMMVSGRLVACIGLSLGLIMFLAGFVNVLSIFGATVFVGIGNGLTMPNASSGAMSSVRLQLAGSAAGLTGSLTVGGGAALTSISSMILSMNSSPITLLGLMLCCALMGLLSALYVIHKS